MNVHNPLHDRTFPACATERARAPPGLPARRLQRLHPTFAVLRVMPVSPAAADGALAGAHAATRV